MILLFKLIIWIFWSIVNIKSFCVLYCLAPFKTLYDIFELLLFIKAFIQLLRVGSHSISKTFPVKSQVYHDIRFLWTPNQPRIRVCFRCESNPLVFLQVLNNVVSMPYLFIEYFFPFKTRMAILIHQIKLCVAFLEAFHYHHTPQLFPLHLHEIFDIHGWSCWFYENGCFLWVLATLHMASIHSQLFWGVL